MFLYSTFKMSAFNRSILYFRYECFKGMLQGLFKLFEAESIGSWVNRKWGVNNSYFYFK